MELHEKGSIFYIATKEKAEEQIMTAKELIDQIETYCLSRLDSEKNV